MLRRDSDHAYRAEALSNLPWLNHAFGTRLNTPSEHTAPLASLRQVHSAKVLVAGHAGVIGQGDALISRRKGIALAIRTADCLPVLMADSRNHAVAAVHAGWRGVVQEIVPKTVAAMASEFGTGLEDLVVAIGPGIGPCCFEVGPEVAIQFTGFFPERPDLSLRAKIDLSETVIRQLRRIGVRQGQICASQLCTFCEFEVFHSYRRDRESAGRMVSTIEIRR